ncbi:MAG: S8 family serine peptidase [Kangiellaceae bacterium]|nr:S8 family serine peptidase [Kangiellaceae bacterium]
MKFLKNHSIKIASSLILAAGLSVYSTNAHSASKPEFARYIIKYKTGVNSKAVAAIKAQGGEIKLELNKHDAIAAILPGNAVQNLQNNPNIEYIEIDAEKELLLQNIPYAIPMLQADLVSDSLTSNQRVCVIDTGLDASHEDMAGNNMNGQGDWNIDPNGHGTLMTSAIASVNNNVGVVGVAPNNHINIHMLSIWERYASNYIKALDNCQAAGANIVTISAGNALESRTEERAFQQAYDNGVLIFAAIGNNGDNTINYPSAYSSVIGVGSINKDKEHSFFSVFNEHVELVAPGWYTLGAYSTQTANITMQADVLVNGFELEPTATRKSLPGEVTAIVVDCGDGLSLCPAAQGNICLITGTQSRNVTTEVQNCEQSGGLAALVHGDQFVIGYSDGEVDEGQTSIPSLNLRDDDAAYLRTTLGTTITVKTWDSDYQEVYGTSMSTPYAAASAALVWSYHPQCTNQQIRDAVNMTAEDLGDSGRDIYYGFGIPQILAAKTYLDQNGCASEPPVTSIELTVAKRKQKGQTVATLNWNGLTSNSVNIYRDSGLLISTDNDGEYSDPVSSGTYSYQVCESDNSECSEIVSITI